jgi:hypothetical protein
MAEDRGELRQINWSEAFTWTHIFKSFRLAIHPSKLVLMMMGLVLIWAAGMGLQWLFGLSECGWNRPDAVASYLTSPKTYDADQKAWIEGCPGRAVFMLSEVRRENATYGQLTSSMSSRSINYGGAFRTEFDRALKRDQSVQEVPKDVQENSSKAFRMAKSELCSMVSNASQALETARKKAADGKDKAEVEQVEKDYAAASQSLTDWKTSWADILDNARGQGTFDVFAAHEWNCIDGGISAVMAGNFVKGLQEWRTAPEKGVLAWVLMGAEGFKWLFDEHIGFAIVFLLVALAIWALFGGATYRVAALQAAREEKISMFQALRFSGSKWASFFTAPIIPIGVIVVLGLLITLGSLIANIPVVGAPIVGIGMVLALGLGMMIAFVTVGLSAGAGLMYPTIAVEGSDSFDAISRSFAYVYARPWRTILYTLIALVYGVLCYLFVRLFALIALTGIYTFMRLGVWTGGQSLGETSKIPVIWKEPTWASLHGNFNWQAMGTGETVAAIFIWIWTAIVAALVGAFLLSFLASSSTVIYTLLRRKVDATDLDDVYVPETEEAPPEGVSTADTAPAAPAAPASPEQAPPLPENPPAAP